MIRLNFPTNFYVEATNECSLACEMCPREALHEPQGRIDPELFRSIVDQLAGHGVKLVALHQFGEPLLHPQIADLVADAKSRGILVVRFATNGTLLDEEIADRLIAAGLDMITVSMDSLTGPRYAPSMADTGAFDDLDERIRLLLERRRRSGGDLPRVEMRIIDSAATHDLVDTFVAKWTGVADRVDVMPAMSWAGSVDQPGRASTLGAAQRLICREPLRHGVIRWNGQVVLCHLAAARPGAAPVVLGDAVTTPLRDVFLGERRRALIDDIVAGRYELADCCRDCRDWVDVIDVSRGRAAGVDI